MSPKTFVRSNELDFRRADCTAIISDLHLCEAEPVHQRFPLWKKYKTREFFFDHQFSDFLKVIEKKAGKRTLELVLNGDIFDFDSFTRLPQAPVFRLHWIEKKRGLYPRPERSLFKIQEIIKDHFEFFHALRDFVLKGHRVIFITGNHDVELHFYEVQDAIVTSLNLPEDLRKQVRFVEWFYISNSDTLIEHGNQYDPYCVCEDPINPFIRGYNFISLRIPFGNLATRYMINGMGFFNPHSDQNYIMSLGEYVRFFLKYMFRAQPDLVLAWFFGSLTTLVQASMSQFSSPIRNPLAMEEKVAQVAEKSNAEPRMVRELREIFVTPAARNPLLLMRELWLDRAFLLLIGFYFLYEFMINLNRTFGVSVWWGILPFLPFPPFFLFYSKSITSMVSAFKEVDAKTLSMIGAIANVKRVVFGHTHQAKHEIVGSIEYLNSGTWSPAFRDVECTQPIGKKSFIWIADEEGRGDKSGSRVAELLSL